MIHKPARFIDTSVANAQSCINMYQDPTWKLDMQMSVEVSSPTWLELWAAVMPCRNVFLTLPWFNLANLATCLLWRLGLGHLLQFCRVSFIFRTITLFVEATHCIWPESLFVNLAVSSRKSCEVPNAGTLAGAVVLCFMRIERSKNRIVNLNGFLMIWWFLVSSAPYPQIPQTGTISSFLDVAINDPEPLTVDSWMDLDSCLVWGGNHQVLSSNLTRKQRKLSWNTSQSPAASSPANRRIMIQLFKESKNSILFQPSQVFSEYCWTSWFPTKV